MINKLKYGEITKAEFQKSIIIRDIYAYCAMDSSSINYAYMDILMEEFPDAKFIFTIRDCYSWMNSIANYLLSFPKGLWFNPLPLEWVNPFDRSVMNKDEINKRMHKLIDEALNCWGAENKKILDQLPPDRSLLIKTDSISEKLNEMARFMGIPLDKLYRDAAHSWKANYKFNILCEIDYDFLLEKFNKHCSLLMEEFFPRLTLDDYLSNYPPMGGKE